MNPNATRALALRLMDEHGLIAKGWKFKWSTAKRAAGMCNYGTRTISISKPLTAEWTEDHVRNTILHEIAHALVGPGHGHGRIWERQARAIGNTGDRNWRETADTPAAPPTWIGKCPAGHEHGRYRKPTAVQSCGRCSRRFDRANLLSWSRAA